MLKVLSFHFLTLGLSEKLLLKGHVGYILMRRESRRGLLQSLLSANRPCFCSLLICLLFPAASAVSLVCTIHFSSNPQRQKRGREGRSFPLAESHDCKAPCSNRWRLSWAASSLYVHKYYDIKINQFSSVAFLLTNIS